MPVRICTGEGGCPPRLLRSRFLKYVILQIASGYFGWDEIIHAIPHMNVITSYSIHYTKLYEAFLSELASIGGCASLINADELLDADAMAAFVEEVFLEKGPMDSDGDGVLDPDDQCPGTPIGAKVNAVGCWVLDNVLFDFDKDRNNFV